MCPPTTPLPVLDTSISDLYVDPSLLDDPEQHSWAPASTPIIPAPPIAFYDPAMYQPEADSNNPFTTTPTTAEEWDNYHAAVKEVKDDFADDDSMGFENYNKALKIVKELDDGDKAKLKEMGGGRRGYLGCGLWV
ncbi:Protein of unknown function [Pyronema omphalodes CBS 100304]|uniref:Uncharacterized protein n=1 Tax=Pyronema omphalodes (strain CBS 100304) TaxID=1076935 RepID=U4KZ10_PYROM|nr:Protein of unknown function [Pyronema omphalodes CBS 100304]